ncbi:MAG: hypothetical protein ACKER6_00930 [Candidatus Hodgkinia cicadicola]
MTICQSNWALQHIKATYQSALNIKSTWPSVERTGLTMAHPSLIKAIISINIIARRIRRGMLKFILCVS